MSQEHFIRLTARHLIYNVIKRRYIRSRVYARRGNDETREHKKDVHTHMILYLYTYIVMIVK